MAALYWPLPVPARSGGALSHFRLDRLSGLILFLACPGGAFTGSK